MGRSMVNIMMACYGKLCHRLQCDVQLELHGIERLFKSLKAAG